MSPAQGFFDVLWGVDGNLAEESRLRLNADRTAANTRFSNTRFRFAPNLNVSVMFNEVRLID
jgi:hypothetical protein